MQRERKKCGHGVELQKWLSFHLYTSERNVLQVAVRQPGGETWANKTLARKRDPQSLWLLEWILEDPERVAARLWPELEPVFGGPGWERETALASACGWPASQEELKRYVDLLWAAFDLWLASNPKSEWCAEEAVRLLAARKPSERFLATSPESLILTKETGWTKETGCGSFLDAFPQLRTWFEIRGELRHWLAVTGAEPWPSCDSPPGTSSLAEFIGHKRKLTTRYSSPFLVSIAWAELVHFAQANAVGSYCANCGKGFVISFRQRNRQRYCSRACWETANKERRKLYLRDYARSRRKRTLAADATEPGNGTIMGTAPRDGS